MKRYKWIFYWFNPKDEKQCEWVVVDSLERARRRIRGVKKRGLDAIGPLRAVYATTRRRAVQERDSQ